MSNCGLKALEQMANLKNISMFSLIHLAKDNGVNLYFCKVEPEELVSVTRPAIFHQKNHFVLVDNDKPMPAGEYDGYVLTPKPMHEPLPYSLAKKIRGAKKAREILAPIATGVASMINPMLGAAVGAGFGGYNASKAPGGLSKNWYQIPLGAASGFTQGGGLAKFGSSWAAGGNAAAGLNAALAATGQVPGAMKTGNWMSPITAGIGGYMGAKMVGGAKTGMESAGSGFWNQATGAAKGGFNAIMGGGQGAQTSAANAATGGTTPAGYGGSYTVPGIGSNVAGTPGIAGPSGFGGSSFGAGASSTIPGVTAATTGGGNFFSKLSGMIPGGKGGQYSGLDFLKMGASALIKPPKQESYGDNYSKAAQYIGGDQWKALPEASRKQLTEYTNASLEELTAKFEQGNDKALNQLDQQKQQAVDQLMVTYANHGQDPYTSTDAQQKLSEINRQYDQAKSEMVQEMKNQAQNQAIQFKKDILQMSINQGQFDNKAFLELAELYNFDTEAKNAMKNKDYEGMQSILAEIFTRDYQQGKSQN
jgi:hypothetical protein